MNLRGGAEGNVGEGEQREKAEKLLHHPMRKWNIEQHTRKASSGAFFNIQNWIVKIIIATLLRMSNIVLTSGPSAVWLAERIWRDPPPTDLRSLCSWYAGSMQTVCPHHALSLSLPLPGVLNGACTFHLFVHCSAALICLLFLRWAIPLQAHRRNA